MNKGGNFVGLDYMEPASYSYKPNLTGTFRFLYTLPMLLSCTEAELSSLAKKAKWPTKPKMLTV